MTRLSTRRGSAALEFALTFPLLLTLAYGAFELTRAIERGAAITDAARHGALVGARTHEDLPATGTTIETAAETAASAALAEMGVTCGAGCTVDATFQTISGWEMVTVQITVPYASLTGVPFAPGTLTREITELTRVQNP